MFAMTFASPSSEARPLRGDAPIRAEHVIARVLRGGSAGVIGQDAQLGSHGDIEQASRRTRTMRDYAVFLIGGDDDVVVQLGACLVAHEAVALVDCLLLSASIA